MLRSTIRVLVVTLAPASLQILAAARSRGPPRLRKIPACAQAAPSSKCYGIDCLGTYFTHVQTCDVTRVQSAMEWTASVYILYTCPNL